MKKWVSMLAMTLLLSSSFISNAFAAETEEEPVPFLEQEPNNSPEQANDITNELDVNGSLPEGDVDIFQFQLDRKSYMNLSGHAKGEGDMVQFIIYDSNNNLVHNSGEPHGTEIHYDRVLKPGTYYLELKDYNQNAQTEDYAFRLLVQTSDIMRVGGADRYETAVNMAYAGWLRADNIVLATGENFPDALAAGPLASNLDAPLLLTKRNQLPEGVRYFIQDYGVQRVTIIGGTGVVSQGIENYLRNTLGLEVTRIAGNDRFETAAKIADQVSTWYKAEVFVVNGRNFPDALSAAPMAAYRRAPILLTESNSLPAVTANKAGQYYQAFVVGGTGVVTDSVLKKLPKATRIGGLNRYETAIAVADYFTGPDTHSVFITTGEKFPDALSASVLAAAHNSPIILTPSSSLHPKVKSFMESSGFIWHYIIGGTGAVSNTVEQDIWSILK